jgi:iron-sulfur cluster insertion protein
MKWKKMIKEINFSKKAVERIDQLIEKKPMGTFFRIAVEGGGCSGFKYNFTFDNKIDDTDLKHNNIVIDKSSLEMLKGSNVDFTEELIGNSFKISNPKTKSSCGCGISFSF